MILVHLLEYFNYGFSPFGHPYPSTFQALFNVKAPLQYVGIFSCMLASFPFEGLMKMKDYIVKAFLNNISTQKI